MTSQQNDAPAPGFSELGLGRPLVAALEKLGYETPSPIQAACIPQLLDGADIIGQAQTGTGKTAAFALPVLQKLDLARRSPQVLVLTPTRELALQVAEAFHRYAEGLKGFRVLPVYGGADMRAQLRALHEGVHVVVGTPGRLLDHLRRETLDLSALKTVVLDEADEMLRMGFIDDVETLLASTPPSRQTALFSATMPPRIRQVAERHLRDPASVRIESKTSTVAAIDQFYLVVRPGDKLDLLTQVLDAEQYDGMIIFVRTRENTALLAEKLTARGIRCAAISGDVSQTLREKTIQQLRKGSVDVLIATDVAARGLDVERITHVINYDIPYDSESYVHRIGRTGRAGRQGRALLFVAPREQRLLQSIERATRQPIERYRLPSSEELAAQRQARVVQQVAEALEEELPAVCLELVDRIVQELGQDARTIAAAVLRLLVSPETLVPQTQRRLALEEDRDSGKRDKGNRGREDRDRQDRDRDHRGKGSRDKREHHDREPRREKPPRDRVPEGDMETYRLDVGREHGVMPADIVGAIANEADISSRFIGRIELHDNWSSVDLPIGMPPDVFRMLQKVRVRNRPLRIARMDDANLPVKPAGKPAGKIKTKTKASDKFTGKPAGKSADKPTGKARHGKRKSNAESSRFNR